MAKFIERIRAQKLRRMGWSIGSIAKHVGVSKGTASIWCQGVVLTQKQTSRLRQSSILAGHKGRMIGAEMNRKKKQDIVSASKKKSLETVGRMTERDLLMLGVGLY